MSFEKKSSVFQEITKDKGVSTQSLSDNSIGSSDSIFERDAKQSHLEKENKNPFKDPKIAEYYRDLYERTNYECRIRFDPDFSWQPKEEKKLVRYLDWKVTFLACFMFVGLQIDRGNLTQAVSDSMLEDLHMSTNQYNNGLTIFYLAFLCAELPSQLVSKRLGSDVWIPIEMCIWSLICISQCELTNATGFYITRCLLGLMEGGFIPDLVLWLSYFYTSAELSIRLSFFWTTLSLTKIIASLLAYGIFHIETKRPGWSWLFLIEGIFTLAIGIASYFLMVPSAVQTKKPWNKKGWFTEREEMIVVNRVLRDDPTKGDMHNRQGLNLGMLYQAIMDWHLWPIYIIGIVAYIPIDTVDSYLTLLLKSMGYTTFHVNLLAMPSYALTIVILLFTTWFSEKTKSIFNVALIQPLWQVPLLGVLRWWKGSFDNKWPTYVIITLIMGTPYIHAMMVSACSRNSQSIKTRTVSASIYNMFVQAGSIIGSNVYRTRDKPYYRTGNTALFALSISMFPILILTKLFYVILNKRRENKWSKMTVEEREEYILTTKDRGSSKLNFRFAH